MNPTYTASVSLFLFHRSEAPTREEVSTVRNWCARNPSAEVTIWYLGVTDQTLENFTQLRNECRNLTLLNCGEHPYIQRNPLLKSKETVYFALDIMKLIIPITRLLKDLAVPPVPQIVADLNVPSQIVDRVLEVNKEILDYYGFGFCPTPFDQGYENKLMVIKALNPNMITCLEVLELCQLKFNEQVDADARNTKDFLETVYTGMSVLLLSKFGTNDYRNITFRMEKDISFGYYVHTSTEGAYPGLKNQITQMEEPNKKFCYGVGDPLSPSNRYPTLIAFNGTPNSRLNDPGRSRVFIVDSNTTEEEIRCLLEEIGSTGTTNGFTKCELHLSLQSKTLISACIKATRSDLARICCDFLKTCGQL